MRSLAFLLGLFTEPAPAVVAREDFEGEHGDVLRLAQRLGFLSTEPECNLHPSCPYCCEGVPLRLGTRLLCGECLSELAARELQVWRLGVQAFVSWLAAGLNVNDTPEQIVAGLWQLGQLREGAGVRECFFLQRGIPGESGRKRLSAYRDAVLLVPLARDAAAATGFSGPCVSLLELLSLDGEHLSVRDLARLLDGGSSVRFEEETGALWIGNSCTGEVPVGSKEFHFLACLARQQDRFVPYTDIKHFVLAKTGSRDSTDEASFCHKLKGRIKERWIAQLDRLIVVTKKSDGYRLRKTLALSAVKVVARNYTDGLELVSP